MESATAVGMTSTIVKAWLTKAFSPRYLLITNTVTGTTFLTAGDVIHQHLSAIADNEQRSFDWKRALRVATMGLILSPLNHFYYKWLDSYVVKGTRGVIVAKKLAVDTATAPVMAVSYVVGINVLEGEPLSTGFDEYKRKFHYFAALDVFLWLPVQAINFWFLPPTLRVVFVSTAALVDSVVIAHIKQTEHPGQKAAEKVHTG